ncbi:hypothetical protein PtA15_1A878 [Puccinia triticina]|uniref:Mid2 domain-containing protein n=1 Tax=Puccinia triticina TaxID=208348 RepID=A0ABY7CBK3_9BASI|nr:uncharacterized protein PtA15_1A878 [Puccinia triticina]WAQ81536.1 hypothetical protein PtA15_1A878 [Puccinia triticina]
MLAHLHNRANGTTPLPTKQEMPPKPIGSVAPPANPVVNPHPPNQVPVNNTPTQSANRGGPAVDATHPPAPVASTDPHPSGLPPVAAPATAVVSHPTTTTASALPLETNSAKLPTVSTPTGLAGSRSVWEANRPDNNFGGARPIQQHISTGMIVAIGVSSIAIALMFLILLRFFFKRLRNKTEEQPADDTFIVIPSTAFLDHPKNQEMGGVGASPMINRSASTSSVRSNMSFTKPQEQSLLHFTNPYSEFSGSSNKASQANQPHAMEFLDPTGMGTPFTQTQSKGWDGSRPAQGTHSYY